MNKIVFRADASINIGYGHFVRTLALADMLKKKFDCYFATVNPTYYQLEEIEKVCKYIPLPDNDEHFDFFLSLLKGDEIIVLDNYFFTVEYQIKIKERGCTLVCIDDLHDKHYVADVVINHCLTDKSLFSVEPYTKLCLGFDWALLRSPFLKQSDRFSLATTPKTVVVCFGGVDSHDFTGKVIASLSSISSIEQIIAIIGDGYLGMHQDTSKVCFKHNLSAKEMAAIFNYADYAFLSASTVCIEALSCHTSVAAGYYVDNQTEFYNELKDKQYIYPLKSLYDVDWETVIVKAISQKKRNEVRFPVNIKSHYINLFEEISIYRNYRKKNLLFVDYRNLTGKQNEIVWKMRNDDSIRCWMDNPNIFSLKSHLSFVDGLKSSKNKIYWAVFVGSTIIGSVNIDITNCYEAERGLFISPYFIGKSIGGEIENGLENILGKMEIKRITAKVLRINERSLRFHLKNQYAIINENEKYYYLVKELNG